MQGISTYWWITSTNCAAGYIAWVTLDVQERNDSWLSQLSSRETETSLHKNRAYFRNERYHTWYRDSTTVRTHIKRRVTTPPPDATQLGPISLLRVKMMRTNQIHDCSQGLFARIVRKDYFPGHGRQNSVWMRLSWLSQRHLAVGSYSLLPKRNFFRLLSFFRNSPTLFTLNLFRSSLALHRSCPQHFFWDAMAILPRTEMERSI